MWNANNNCIPTAGLVGAQYPQSCGLAPSPYLNTTNSFPEVNSIVRYPQYLQDNSNAGFAAEKCYNYSQASFANTCNQINTHNYPQGIAVGQYTQMMQQTSLCPMSYRPQYTFPAQNSAKVFAMGMNRNTQGTMFEPMQYPTPGPSTVQQPSEMVRSRMPVMYPQATNDASRPMTHCQNAPTAETQWNAGAKDVFTYPVEMILKPFILEHNVTVSEFKFMIPMENCDMIQSGNLDLQLKCFENSDKRPTQDNSWPRLPNNNQRLAVKLTVNNVPVQQIAFDRSVYLGACCSPGLNILSFTAASCVCTHSFVLYLVSRRPLHAVVSDVITHTRSIYPNSFIAREKVLRMIQSVPQQRNASLYFYVSGVRHKIRLPARSLRCAHVACFDLETFLSRNSENSCFECPLASCKKFFTLNEIEVDQYMYCILAESTRFPDPIDVSIDPLTGRWQIIEPRIEPSQQHVAPASTTTGKERTSKPRKRQTDAANGEVSKTNKRSKNANTANDLKSVLRELPRIHSTFNPATIPSTSWQPTSVCFPSSVSPCVPPKSISPPNLQKHMQRIGPPSTSSKYFDPGTPLTPNTAQNPPSIGPIPSISPNNGNSQTIIQQQGSIEANSVAGSAPYTPSSVGSVNGNPTAHSAGLASLQPLSSEETKMQKSLSITSFGDLTSSLKVDDVNGISDLVYWDAKTSSAAEMEKYLTMENSNAYAELNAAVEYGTFQIKSNVQVKVNSDVWSDISELIAEQS